MTSEAKISPTKARTRRPRSLAHAVARAAASSDCEELRWLVTHWGHEDSLLNEIAENPATPPELLVVFTMGREGWTSVAAAKNPSFPATVLLALARSDDYELRMYAAANPTLPLDVIERLRHDKAMDVREFANANAALPRATLNEVLLRETVFWRVQELIDEVEAKVGPDAQRVAGLVVGDAYRGVTPETTVGDLLATFEAAFGPMQCRDTSSRH
jgi:hypothetical protein